MEIYKQLGVAGLANRLQKMSETFWNKRDLIYKELNIPFKAKWIPVIYILNNKEKISVKEISLEMGFSHPSVIQILKEMEEHKFVKWNVDKEDKRSRLISLTANAKREYHKFAMVWQTLREINTKIIDTPNNLLKAIEEVEKQFETIDYNELFYEKYNKKIK
jgi:MarR family transcriptional regulator, repressor for mepA